MRDDSAFVRLRTELRCCGSFWRWFRFSRCGHILLGCCGFGGCFGCAFLFRLSAAARPRRTLVTRKRFNGMDPVIILVTFRPIRSSALRRLLNRCADTQCACPSTIPCHLEFASNGQTSRNRHSMQPNCDCFYHFAYNCLFGPCHRAFWSSLLRCKALRRPFFLANLAPTHAAGMRNRWPS